MPLKTFTLYIGLSLTAIPWMYLYQSLNGILFSKLVSSSWQKLILPLLANRKLILQLSSALPPSQILTKLLFGDIQLNLNMLFHSFPLKKTKMFIYTPTIPTIYGNECLFSGSLSSASLNYYHIFNSVSLALSIISTLIYKYSILSLWTQKSIFWCSIYFSKHYNIFILPSQVPILF